MARRFSRIVAPAAATSLAFALLSSFAAVPASAQCPAKATVPPPSEKLATEARWDKYRTTREDLAWYRISPEEGALRLLKLADESKGTEIEPFLLFHVAGIRLQQDRFDAAKTIALDLKNRFPQHYLATNKLPAFEGSQVDALLADIEKQVQSRAAVPIVIPEHKPAESPRVVLETTNGRVVIAFYPEQAPKHVENFLKNVESGIYDGTDVFQVQPGTRILLGEKVGTFPTPEDARIPTEINVIPHARGAVAMYYIDPIHGDHAKIFGISFGHPVFLDLESTVFGQVIEGMDVVDTVAHAPIDKQGFFPVQPVKIEKAFVER